MDAYRQSLMEVGLYPADFPVATTGFFYAADTTQNALKEYYPHIDEGMKKSNGQGLPKQMFAQGVNELSVMLVGSP